MAHAPVIGIVGGIGSGKSLVATEFVRHGGVLVAGDQLGHAALREPEVKSQIVARWGEQVLDANGEVDRRRLGAIVFGDSAERQALEAITHPIIGQRIREAIAEATRRPQTPLIVLDAAVMLEAGWHDICDYLLFIDSPRDVRLQRLQERRGWSAHEVEERERAQMPLQEKRQYADAVVENAASPEQVADQVHALLDRWKLL
jgi:dephospho-CoA kinase